MKTHYGVVLLAAGASARMGRPKLLLPWGKTTILGHLINQWHALSAAQVAVVHAGNNPNIMAELDRLAVPLDERILNPNPELGMFSSIQCAARWAGWRPELTHWMIALGDQPQISQAALASLLTAGLSQPEKICQLSYQGRARHPVWVPKPHFIQLAMTPESTLSGFLRNAQHELYCVACEDAGLAMDIDNPDDYQKAINLYFPEA